MGIIELSTIAQINATTAELLRSCQLRGGLTRASGTAAFVLGNPKGWLGSAYHSVLERIGRVDLHTEPIETAVDRLWNEAITEQYGYVMRHALNRRFGPPQTWPGYYLALASVNLRAREVAGTHANARRNSIEGAANRQPVIREQLLSAYSGKLVGRPDVVRDGQVIDYKSGGLVEFDEESQTDVIKASFVRQLRIYGYLVHESLGWWPQRGILYPLGGRSVEVELDPAACSHAAKEAIDLLDAYNAAIRNDTTPHALASPSPANCKWCPYKAICDPFWENVSPEWSGELDGAAIRGRVRGSPRAIQGGAALAISVDIERGTEAPGDRLIAPINPIVQNAVSRLINGDRVRLVTLRVRPDGNLVPSLRTVIAEGDTIPSIVLESAAA